MKINELFKVFYGQHEYNNKEALDNGDTLLISSQAPDNGCYGFFDVNNVFTPPFITVPRTGSIGYANVQLTSACVDDNVLILLPNKKYTLEYLFYVSTMIRHVRWRYSYGRLITPKRIGMLEVEKPDKFKTSINFNEMERKLYPSINKTEKIENAKKYENVEIEKYFKIIRGDFHAIDQLEKGSCFTVSKVSKENGFVGFYEKPYNAKLYNNYVITISTVTGDAFFQFISFIATDNVLVLQPKINFSPQSLIYIQALINKTKWRYSYGRQPYKRIFQKTILNIPVTADNMPDQEFMNKVVENQSYWEEFKNRYL